MTMDVPTWSGSSSSTKMSGAASSGTTSTVTAIAHLTALDAPALEATARAAAQAATMR